MKEGWSKPWTGRTGIMLRMAERTWLPTIALSVLFCLRTLDSVSSRLSSAFCSRSSLKKISSSLK
jgi:hypothetical protein